MRTKPASKTPQEINAYVRALGARLRVEREAQNISLVDLATASGCGLNSLRWHEAGARMLRADTVASLAKTLHVDPQILMVPHYDDREADENIRVALGIRMQAERAKAKKLQMEVVRGARVTMSSLYRHETGVASLTVDAIVRIAKFFKIEPSELLKIELPSSE